MEEDIYEYDFFDPKYITANELAQTTIDKLDKNTLYELVKNIEGDTIELSQFEPLFIVSHDLKLTCYIKVDLSPKYYEGLYSVYAIIDAIERFASTQDEWELEDVTRDPVIQQIIIKYTDSTEHTSTPELTYFMQTLASDYAEKVRSYLFQEAKYFKFY